MSDSLERQLKEDRALRNAARALVEADISHVKADFSAKNVGVRFAGRMKEGAIDVYEDAVDIADDNRGVLTTLIAAVVIWFARNPIMSLFDDSDPDEEISCDETEEFEETEAV